MQEEPYISYSWKPSANYDRHETNSERYQAAANVLERGVKSIPLSAKINSILGLYYSHLSRALKEEDNKNYKNLRVFHYSTIKHLFSLSLATIWQDENTSGLLEEQKSTKMQLNSLNL